jgi:hypothetical protein
VLVKGFGELLVDQTVDEAKPVSDRALISHVVRLIPKGERRWIIAQTIPATRGRNSRTAI